MLFPDSVYIEKKVSTNASHKTTYDTPTLCKCNLQQGLQVIKSANGESTVASAWIGFPPKTDIGESDRITLPDGTQPSISSVAPKRNDYTKKVVYIEVYLTKSSPAGSVV